MVFNFPHKVAVRIFDPDSRVKKKKEEEEKRAALPGLYTSNAFSMQSDLERLGRACARHIPGCWCEFQTGL